jgi:hypothetical protein
MFSEERVTELAIRWYFLALLSKKETPERSAPIFSKAHAYIHVLGLPTDIGCGKKSEDGLKKYAKQLLDEWVSLNTDSELSCDLPSTKEWLSVNEWLTENVMIDFENHI